MITSTIAGIVAVFLLAGLQIASPAHDYWSIALRALSIVFVWGWLQHCRLAAVAVGEEMKAHSVSAAPGEESGWDVALLGHKLDIGTWRLLLMLVAILVLFYCPIYTSDPQLWESQSFREAAVLMGNVFAAAGALGRYWRVWGWYIKWY